jgi:hypothetical protein
METVTLLIVLIVAAVWAVVFVAGSAWDDIAAWWLHRQARAVRRRHRAPHLRQRSTR